MSRTQDESRYKIIEIEPDRCIPWGYHNRDRAWLTEENCSDLIFSIQKNGQIHPALVRKILNHSKYDYELIYGVRRWFACSQIPNQKLLAQVIDEDDKTCAILMHTENADSKDISEFERAASFAQQLRSGLFKNQNEIARAMGVTQGLISRMVKASELFHYEWLRELFPNKLEIKIKPAYKLVSLFKDKNKEEIIKMNAQKIAKRLKGGEKISGDHILKSLLQTCNMELGTLEKKEMIIPLGELHSIHCKKDLNGKIILTIEGNNKMISKENWTQAIQKVVEDFILS